MKFRSTGTERSRTSVADADRHCNHKYRRGIASVNLSGTGQGSAGFGAQEVEQVRFHGADHANSNFRPKYDEIFVSLKLSGRRSAICCSNVATFWNFIAGT